MGRYVDVCLQHIFYYFYRILARHRVTFYNLSEGQEVTVVAVCDIGVIRTIE